MIFQDLEFQIWSPRTLLGKHQQVFVPPSSPGSRSSWFPGGLGASSVINQELDCHSWPGTLRKEQVKFGMPIHFHFLVGSINLNYNILIERI